MIREIVYQVGWDEEDTDGNNGTLIRFNVYSEHATEASADDTAFMLPERPYPGRRAVDVYIRKVYKA
jgi:hypothetical protein